MFVVNPEEPLGSFERDGIFIDRGTIIDVADLHAQDVPFSEAGGKVDVGLQLKIDIGKSFFIDVPVYAEAVRAEDKLTGLGRGGRTLKELFKRLNIKLELLDDGSFTPGCLAALKGKPVLRLSYVSKRKPDGKLGYATWRSLGSIEEGEDAYRARFKKSAAEGFPKNYHPELLNEPASAAPSYD